MLKVYTADGKVLSFELRDEAQLREWERLASSSAFQESIRGVALLQHRVLSHLQLPKTFRTLRFSAELLRGRVRSGEERVTGERVVCQADMVRISLTAYHTETPKMVRVDVVRSGRQRYDGRPSKETGS